MRKKIDIRHLAAALLAALMLLACLPVTQADAAGNTKIGRASCRERV